MIRRLRDAWQALRGYAAAQDHRASTWAPSGGSATNEVDMSAATVAWRARDAVRNDPYSNSVEAVRTIRADRNIEGPDPGIARATGQITARFADTTLLTQAQNDAPAEFAFSYTIDANRSLTFTLHEVYLALARTPIEGPTEVEATFEFRATLNATATRMMTAVLKNQQADTEYA